MKAPGAIGAGSALAAAGAPAADAQPVLGILGVPVLAATTLEAVRLIDRRCKAGEPIGIAFLNAHGSNLAARDAGFAGALCRMLVLNDGVGIDIAARILAGRGFPENLNGTDFLPAFLAQTEQEHRLFLFGGRPGVAERASAAITKNYPRHRVVGIRHGYYDAAGMQAVVEDIRASGATLLLVALGNPAQELWIARHLAATGVRVAFGVGALFDFLAGEVSRAPALVRRARLEWIWRLMLEPKRLFRRYVLGNPLFLLRVLRKRLAG